MNAAQKRLDTLLADWSTTENTVPHAGASITLLENVEKLITACAISDISKPTWQRYLEITRHPHFLTNLPDADTRMRWAETTYPIIEQTRFTLADLLAQRTEANPSQVLFRELGSGGSGNWTYAQIQRRAQSTAAFFHAQTQVQRVAIFSENSIASACCDLACLFYDIFVTPLNIHFDSENLAWICNRLQITSVVVDTERRLQKMLEVRQLVNQPFAIYRLTGSNSKVNDDYLLLEKERSRLAPDQIAKLLADRPRMNMRDVATVMFTSGSTGRPKGVAFSIYNLVTKRFARAAALPSVGCNEVMLCYLPLFHTFGRYLEMLGMVFWGGTYVFAGNPTPETLLNQLQNVEPTALISIPLRWEQIFNRCQELSQANDSSAKQQEIFRSVVGKRLAWGLSAAGYLDPVIFKYFQQQGIGLCSGFGMTEGTGGLTMTPPEDYRAGSVGIPLPGVRIRFGEHQELQIAGPYIARYLQENDQPGSLTIPDPDTDEHWLATGDIFHEVGDGHLAIVDRIKDIYKNNRGQTIAPRRVESQFTGVPGIKSTFLAGDGRAYNTLLIVPDEQDDVLISLKNSDEIWEYFHQLVTAANENLALYERVVNFAVLDRDFDLKKDELTPKGSFRRKKIEENFRDIISQLYNSNTVTLEWSAWQIQIPRWVYRDLGILEDAIEVRPDGLFNLETGRLLPLKQLAQPEQPGNLLVGDLAYDIQDKTLNLGVFSRQPLLWCGNPTLASFCPCKTGWEVSLANVAEQVFRPESGRGEPRHSAALKHIPRRLLRIDKLLVQALFGIPDQSLNAIDQLARQLQTTDDRHSNLIRRRLEALAWHPDEQVRCQAYQVLLLDEPTPDYNTYLPAFITSQKTFLCDQSITAIASTNIEPRRLQAFRQRMQSYRQQLAWPASLQTRRLIDDLLRLLANFARYCPEYYSSIREELVSWILHDSDPELARCAEQHFHDLANWFEGKLSKDNPELDSDAWTNKIAFQPGLTPLEVERLQRVLVGTTFLDESLRLIFEGEKLVLNDINPSGIWVSRILSQHEYSRYRVSINTQTGQHFDLQLIIREDLDQELVLETIFWLIAIRGFPQRPTVLPRFGCCRPELGAISLGYISDLTVWEKIREYAGVRGPGTRPPTKQQWRRLLITAMATNIVAWRNSGQRILPGDLSATNVVVPEPDFREGCLLNSLSGWQTYSGPASLIKPLVQIFYQQTISHYPWCKKFINRNWIFAACVEALGSGAIGFLDELQEDLADQPLLGIGSAGFETDLQQYRQQLRKNYYIPLAIVGACDRYLEWGSDNPQATVAARLDQLEELYRLYRLDRYPEIARYTLYQRTYFAKAAPPVQQAFGSLVSKLFECPDRRATRVVELSDLQQLLTDPDDRRAFRRLAFPHAQVTQELEVMAIGDRQHEHMIVRSQINDSLEETYIVNEPTGPAEIGQLYRLFLLAGFPKTINEQDQFFVVSNNRDQIVGGVCYQWLAKDMVHLDGITVAGSLLDRGLTSAILTDFCTRMVDHRCQAIRTHYFLRSFYQRRGFQVDRKWGGLVRFLNE